MAPASQPLSSPPPCAAASTQPSSRPQTSTEPVWLRHAMRSPTSRRSGRPWQYCKAARCRCSAGPVQQSTSPPLPAPPRPSSLRQGCRGEGYQLAMQDGGHRGKRRRSELCGVRPPNATSRAGRAPYRRKWAQDCHLRSPRSDRHTPPLVSADAANRSWLATRLRVTGARPPPRRTSSAILALFQVARGSKASRPDCCTLLKRASL